MCANKHNTNTYIKATLKVLSFEMPSSSGLYSTLPEGKGQAGIIICPTFSKHQIKQVAFIQSCPRIRPVEVGGWWDVSKTFSRALRIPRIEEGFTYTYIHTYMHNMITSIRTCILKDHTFARHEIYWRHYFAQPKAKSVSL